MNPPPPLRRVALLPQPGFSMLALAGVLDCLAAANELQDEVVWRGECVSLLGGPVAAGNGTQLHTAALPADADWHAVVLITADTTPLDAALAARLKHWAGEGRVLAGLDAGAAQLAACGLLDGLAEAHPAVAWANGLWEISPDGRRLSSAGGLASVDLCGAWLAAQHGERLGQELAQWLGLSGLRPRDERQRAGYSERRGAGSPKLAEALPTEEVAQLVGVSRRQLERLFKQHLDSLPSRHYLELRLARAQRLLQQSSQSILQIGLSCGFSSGPHFSNAYKSHFGHTPRDERSRRALAWRAPTSPGETP